MKRMINFVFFVISREHRERVVNNQKFQGATS